jgi:hypothetical protein
MTLRGGITPWPTRGRRRIGGLLGLPALVVALLGLPAHANEPGLSPTRKGTLERSRAETVRVDGRLYEVRIASAGVEGEHQLLIVRATIVINPDPNLESQRNWNVVQPFLQRTCKGPFVVLEHQLVDKVNLYVRFRCGAG